MQLRVVVDVYEREGRLVDALRSLGVRCVRERIRVGDYRTGGAVVERKTVNDLHQSIIDRRLWRQIYRLRRDRSRPYLLVEGTSLDAGPLPGAAVRGALLAVAELDVSVIRTDGQEDSARWLALLAERPQHRRKAASVHTNGLASRNVAEGMLAAIPGISVVSARALLREFGSIANLAAADPKSWLSLPGIGPARATSLEKALHHCTRTSSRARSARQTEPPPRPHL
jgi:ERCC4-type nuclease